MPVRDDPEAQEKVKAFKQSICQHDLKVVNIRKSASGEDLCNLVSLIDNTDVNLGLKNALIGEH